MKNLQKFINYIFLTIFIGVGAYTYILTKKIQSLQAENLELRSRISSFEQISDSLYRVNVILSQNLQIFKDSLKQLEGEIVHYQQISGHWEQNYFEMLSSLSKIKDGYFFDFNKREGSIFIAGTSFVYPLKDSAKTIIKIKRDPVKIKLGISKLKDGFKVSWIKVSDPAFIIDDVKIYAKTDKTFVKNFGLLVGYNTRKEILIGGYFLRLEGGILTDFRNLNAQISFRF